MPKSDGRELAPRGEVLPAGQPNTKIHMWNRPEVRAFASGICLLPFAGWLIQNFFQLRGYVNLLASRIHLYSAAACVAAWVWIWARNTQRHKKVLPAILTIVIFVVAFGADRVTLPHTEESPNPQQFPTAAEIAREVRRLGFPSQAAPQKSGELSVPLSVVIESSNLRADSSAWTNGFFFEFEAPSLGHAVLTPSQLAAFVRITNLTNSDIHLVSYSAEIKIGNIWIPLRTISTNSAIGAFDAYPSDRYPSLAEAMKHAIPFDFSEVGLDQELYKMEGLIRPHGMLRGWAFFQYPPGVAGVTNNPIRFTVTDSADHQISSIGDDAGRPTSLPENLEGHGPLQDISAIPIKYLPFAGVTVIPGR